MSPVFQDTFFFFYDIRSADCKCLLLSPLHTQNRALTLHISRSSLSPAPRSRSLSWNDELTLKACTVGHDNFSSCTSHPLIGENYGSSRYNVSHWHPNGRTHLFFLKQASDSHRTHNPAGDGTGMQRRLLLRYAQLEQTALEPEIVAALEVRIREKRRQGGWELAILFISLGPHAPEPRRYGDVNSEATSPPNVRRFPR